MSWNLVGNCYPTVVLHSFIVLSIYPIDKGMDDNG